MVCLKQAGEGEKHHMMGGEGGGNLTIKALHNITKTKVRNFAIQAVLYKRGMYKYQQIFPCRGVEFWPISTLFWSKNHLWKLLDGQRSYSRSPAEVQQVHLIC